MQWRWRVGVGHVRFRLFCGGVVMADSAGVGRLRLLVKQAAMVEKLARHKLRSRKPEGVAEALVARVRLATLRECLALVELPSTGPRVRPGSVSLTASELAAVAGNVRHEQPRACPGCGATCPGGDRVCDACGEELPQPAAREAA